MKTLEALIVFWASHGTKALGSLSTFFSGLTSAAALLTEGGHISTRTVAYIAAANIALGVWTVKRGFANSRVAAESSEQIQTP